MRKLVYKSSFKKDFALMEKRGLPLNELQGIIELLQKDVPLPARYKDHLLSGNWKGFRECHIRPDWLLIYQKQDAASTPGVLKLEATGTHADLF